MLYLGDFSLSNRTGAYYICRDILRGMPHLFSEVRYWRFAFRKEPSGIVQKLLGRAVLLELERTDVDMGPESAPIGVKPLTLTPGSRPARAFAIHR
jgi:hypothetical protein